MNRKNPMKQHEDEDVEHVFLPQRPGAWLDG
jgi:hypothetical protein